MAVSYSHNNRGTDIVVGLVQLPSCPILYELPTNCDWLIEVSVF